MSDEEWLNLDSDHIVSTEPVTVECSNCSKQYMYIRDRCPFCHIAKDSFVTDDNTFYIRNHAIYSKHNGQWYIHNDSTHENVPVDEQNNIPLTRPIRERPQRQSYGFFSMLNDMVSTTIAVAILFALFVAIVYFFDVHVFH